MRPPLSDVAVRVPPLPWRLLTRGRRATGHRRRGVLLLLLEALACGLSVAMRPTGDRRSAMPRLRPQHARAVRSRGARRTSAGKRATAPVVRPARPTSACRAPPIDVRIASEQSRMSALRAMIPRGLSATGGPWSVGYLWSPKCVPRPAFPMPRGLRSWCAPRVAPDSTTLDASASREAGADAAPDATSVRDGGARSPTRARGASAWTAANPRCFAIAGWTTAATRTASGCALPRIPSGGPARPAGGRRHELPGMRRTAGSGTRRDLRRGHV